jgi:hypothetical protein
MLALLLAVAMIALTLLVLLLAGVVAAIVTGIGLLNVLALVIGLRSRPADPMTSAADAPERWRPKSFRRPPAPPLDPEADERLRSGTLTVHRR